MSTALAIAVLPGLSARTTAAASQQGTPKQLLGTLHVTDKKDVPLTDVTASELEVKENGQSHPIQTAGAQPQALLAVALVLDNNSELSTSFMQSVVPAGIAVVKALPPGTTVDIWTTGDRPNHVGKALSDPAEAEAALKGIAAMGTNALLNTIADASKALPSDDNHRLAVIVMTTGTLGDTGGYGYEQALKVTSMRPTFVSLEFVIGKPDAQGRERAQVSREAQRRLLRPGAFGHRVREASGVAGRDRQRRTASHGSPAWIRARPRSTSAVARGRRSSPPDALVGGLVTRAPSRPDAQAAGQGYGFASVCKYATRSATSASPSGGFWFFRYPDIDMDGFFGSFASIAAVSVSQLLRSAAESSADGVSEDGAHLAPLCVARVRLVAHRALPIGVRGLALGGIASSPGGRGCSACQDTDECHDQDSHLSLPAKSNTL